MSNGSTIIIQCIGCPYAAISIIEVVAIGVEVSFLPFKMTFQYRPKFPEFSLVGIVGEMPKKSVNIVEIHVIVVHHIGAVGITANITVAVHLRSPTFLGSCHILCTVLTGMGQCGWDILNLTTGVCLEMTVGAVGKSYGISNIAAPPTGQGCTPTDASMLPSLTIPQSVGSRHKYATKGIEQWVGGIYLYPRHDVYTMGFL